jgi:hypothetical protein
MSDETFGFARQHSGYFSFHRTKIFRHEQSSFSAWARRRRISGDKVTGQSRRWLEFSVQFPAECVMRLTIRRWSPGCWLFHFHEKLPRITRLRQRYSESFRERAAGRPGFHQSNACLRKAPISNISATGRIRSSANSGEIPIRAKSHDTGANI